MQHLPSMCIEGCRCAGVFARDSLLQSSLLEAGIIWHLMIFLFNYDYTLDEATGINVDSSTHETVSIQLSDTEFLNMWLLPNHFGRSRKC